MRTTNGRARAAVVLAGAAAVLTSCGLTGPNSSSSSRDRTTTTRKGTGTVFATVAFVSSTTTTPTTLAPIASGNGDVARPVDTPTSYVVTAGDVAVLIARRFGLTLTELANANPDKNMNVLVVGEQLVIPPPNPGVQTTPTIQPPTATTRVASPTTAAVKTGATYTVLAGDTLVGIAKKLGIQLATLQQLNPGVTPQGLQVGQKLNIPRGGSAATTSTTKKP